MDNGDCNITGIMQNDRGSEEAGMVSYNFSKRLKNSLRLNFSHPNSKQHTHTHTFMQIVGIFTTSSILTSRDEKGE